MILRAAIYARSVSETQSSHSLPNQTAACHHYIDEQGMQFTESYEDAATGGIGLTRPGYQRLMRGAESGAFDIVVVESIDRLSRNLADLAHCYDQLLVLGIQLHAVGIGLVTQMHTALLGTMVQMQLRDLAAKTKRIQLSRVRAGKVPGGVAFGYDILPPTPGPREGSGRRINPAEAVIVQKIFRDYAAGKPASSIAADLNKEGKPGPGGRPWRSATIRGQVERGTGVLNNALYIGQLIWNRRTYTKDPRTGERIARLNHSNQHLAMAVPELQIIDTELWQRVKERQAASVA